MALSKLKRFICKVINIPIIVFYSKQFENDALQNSWNFVYLFNATNINIVTYIIFQFISMNSAIFISNKNFYGAWIPIPFSLYIIWRYEKFPISQEGDDNFQCFGRSSYSRPINSFKDLIKQNK